MRDGSRINAPASPRQQWVVEMWNRGAYDGYRMFPTQEEAEQFASQYEQMLSEFRREAQQ